ncbi:oligosaccharide flippase family protein [Tessaracoccus sp. SD287]|uniref:lipopolysaccharide biosynthesis protein n=1 Tax=Tessaracoccus sp. SD287 TaxID=2782008 RepID=UPI001A958881|nr:oligosaccharide flippase family protein [Tessaracoccus sp. SD287]
MSDDSRPTEVAPPVDETPPPAPSGVIGRVRARLAGQDFLKNVLTLMTGTASAQVLQFLAMIFVGRLFTAAEFGVYVLVMSAVSAVVPIAAGRYELAIVLPRRDNDARQLLRLCTWINVAVSLATIAVMLVISPWLARLMTDQSQADAASIEAGLRFWLYFTGPMVFLVTQLGVMSYWLTRTRNFRQVAQNKIYQSVSVSGLQVGTGAVGMGVSGLVIATIVGYAASLWNLLRKTRGQYRIDGPARSKRELARRYVKMPALNGPNAVVDSVRLNGINALVGANYAAGPVGQFGMAWRLLQAPMGLINAAVAQVFFQRLATVERGQMTGIVRMAIVRSMVIGIVPFALIWSLGPWILPFVLGGDWTLAGEISRVLVPWLYLNFITSPISTVFVTVHRQLTMLLFSIAYMVVPLSILGFFAGDLLTTMAQVSWAMAGLLVVFLLLALLVSWQYDRGFGFRADEVDVEVEQAEQQVTGEEPLDR